MHENHSHTKYKSFWFFRFRWAVIEISTPPATYLLFVELHLPVIIAYKVFKINFKIYILMYFESVFIEPNKFFINIYNNKLFKKITKIAFFEHPSQNDPLISFGSRKMCTTMHLNIIINIHTWPKII